MIVALWLLSIGIVLMLVCGWVSMSLIGSEYESIARYGGLIGMICIALGALFLIGAIAGAPL